jgi:hypothetical protein
MGMTISINAKRYYELAPANIYKYLKFDMISDSSLIKEIFFFNKYLKYACADNIVREML